MADDKRNRGDQQQGGNQDRDRQRQQKDRRPGSGGMESPDSSDSPRKEDDQKEQE